MNWGGYGAGYPLWGAAGLAVGFAFLMAWSLIWKGLALWRAAHRDEKVWFIVFLIVNTLGILEIIYLFLIPKDTNLFSSKPSTEADKKS